MSHRINLDLVIFFFGRYIEKKMAQFLLYLSSIYFQHDIIIAPKSDGGL